MKWSLSVRLEERGFIESLHSDPDADSVQLVYADWLEEQGENNRAEFLRLNVLLSQLIQKLDRDGDPYRSPYVEPIAQTRIRLRELCQEIPANWLAQIHRGKVNSCDFKTAQIPACPSHWQQLVDSDAPLVRRCEVCKEMVRLITSWKELHQYRRQAWLPFV
jgi:uncharacterized protein (TIGR02996 family)